MSYYPDECPFCNLLTQEVNETFRIVMISDIKAITYAATSRWGKLGYCIANKSELAHIPLAEHITKIITDHVKLSIPPNSYTEEDILNHPYVIEKYNELLNK